MKTFSRMPSLPPRCWQVLLLLLLYSLRSEAQFPVLGNLRPGDTTQVHILTTTDGSRLTGRVTGFDSEKIYFLFQQQSPLTFAIGEVKSVEILGEETGAPVTGGGELEYQIFQRNKTLTAQFVKSLYSNVVWKFPNGDKTRLSWSTVDSLILVSPADPARMQLLETKRGDRLQGWMLRFDGDSVHFKLENGIIVPFHLQKIRVIEPLIQDVIKIGNEPPMNVSDKLFYTPTARMLKKGAGEYRNTLIFFNTLDYGLSDNLTIGAGFGTVLAASVFSLRAKVGAKLTDGLHVAAGGQLFRGFFLYENEGETGGLGFGVATIGSTRNFVNLGLGRSISEDGDGANAFIMCASFSKGKNWRGFGEVLILNDSFDGAIQIVTLGASWYNVRHRIDFGVNLIGVDGEGIIVPFPVAAYAYRF